MFSPAFLGAAVSAVVEQMNITQIIQGTIADGTLTTSITLDDEVNLSTASIIVVNANGTIQTIASNLITADFTDSMTARFRRGETTSTTAFYALIVDAPRALNVQYIEASIPSGFSEIPITLPTAVDSINNQVVVFLTNRIGGSVGDRVVQQEVVPTYADSTNLTSITATRQTTGTANFISMFVLELSK